MGLVNFNETVKSSLLNLSTSYYFFHCSRSSCK